MVATGLLNLASLSTPMAADNKFLRLNRSIRSAQSFQVRCDGSSSSRAPDTVKVARREVAFGLAAACLTLASGNAEARTAKPEIRQKIMEKLEMLREKAGLFKQKDEAKKASPPPPPPLPPPSLLNKERKKMPTEPLPESPDATTPVETSLTVE